MRKRERFSAFSFLKKNLRLHRKKGVAISQMANLPWGYYYGDIQDSNINVVIPTKEEYLLPVTAFVTSVDFPRLVRSIDKKLSVTNNTFKKVPFNYDWH